MPEKTQYQNNTASQHCANQNPIELIINGKQNTQRQKAKKQPFTTGLQEFGYSERNCVAPFKNKRSTTRFSLPPGRLRFVTNPKL